MPRALSITIFGTPTGLAKDGSKEEGWRQLAKWLRKQLKRQFGEQVLVEYVDLLADDLSQYPCALNLIRSEDVQVPLVFVNGELYSHSQKISPRELVSYLEQKGLQPT